MGPLIASHLVFLFIMALLYGGVLVVPCWRILRKAGLSPILSILVVVPLVNLGLLYFVAFSDWNRAADPTSL